MKKFLILMLLVISFSASAQYYPRYRSYHRHYSPYSYELEMHRLRQERILYDTQRMSDALNNFVANGGSLKCGFGVGYVSGTNYPTFDFFYTLDRLDMPFLLGYDFDLNFTLGMGLGYLIVEQPKFMLASGGYFGYTDLPLYDNCALDYGIYFRPMFMVSERTGFYTNLGISSYDGNILGYKISLGICFR